jgi:hypothetical protein
MTNKGRKEGREGERNLLRGNGLERWREKTGSKIKTGLRIKVRGKRKGPYFLSITLVPLTQCLHH